MDLDQTSEDLDLNGKVDSDVEKFQEIITTPHEQFQETDNEKRWRLSYLKNQFECLELDKLFHRYSQRISHGYFSQYLSLQIILITSHFIILLSTVNELTDVIPDLVLYSLYSVISIILLIITDKYVKDHPRLLKYLAGTAFVISFFVNFFIPFHYKDHQLRTAYSTYIIISNYIFLNVHNNLVAFVIGLFVSVFHLVTLILVTYDRNGSNFYQRLGSDIIYLIAINGLGLYFRYMNEIVIRRSFLDRRSCVESTHQLKFEEEQENQLMSSIIPQHIIAIVRKAILDYWKSDNIKIDIPKQKPFDDLYVEEHANVSILFADIVNYTAMTTKLDIIELLEVLNELFGRFDEASEELKVLRIKFLGDCYYCVAGLPPDPAPNHAEACVDLGLKMISIIADIRKRKNLDVNMRIGINSGKISSGIIGTIKWQYDIWSTDVDIANKMETEGTPGMVHITSRTQQILKKSYNISKTKKVINNERTYLIAPKDEAKVTVKNRNTRSDSCVGAFVTLSLLTEVIPNGIVEDKIVTYKEVNENTTDNNNNQRRPTIYIKRNSTVPSDFKPIVKPPENVQRSYSLISNYRALQENLEDAENHKSGKRYTYPTSGERRYSGNPGIENFRRRPSTNSRISSDRRLTNDRKRRTAFMNNNIKRYKERLSETNKELEETIENMLLSKYEQWFKVHDMYRILLIFKNFQNELDFIKMPDPLFKYYFLNEILLVILVFILENLTLNRWDWPTWPFYLIIGVIFVLCLPLCWTHHIWSRYIAKFEYDNPKNKIIYFLTNASKFVTNNVFIRIIIYTVLYILFCLCVLTEWLDCFHVDIFHSASSEHSLKQNFLQLILRSTEHNDTSQYNCIVPWHMTETCALAIIMSFLFLRMYMWLKLLYALAIALVYSYCILQYSGTFYGDSQTFNFLLDPKISHVASVMFLTLTLHLVDRQTEYMNRLDHLWYKNLIDKEKQANKMHTVNNMLLKNILPLHVAELYLNVNRHSSEEVYHEHYDDAAVMFASLINFSVEEMGQTFLKVMHAIIAEFDMLSVEKTWGRPIEKIKIAKWTYMAACGLAPGFGNWENMLKDQGEHVVISLLKFAASLMQKLKNINSEIQFNSGQDIKLRIGISYGPIAAGVVGSKKPLYDIWGDPVNMASRMDTTGLPDHIQVLESTAEIIQRFGYGCVYRGQTVVKGREHPVRTYFVSLDETFNLIKTGI